jgi:hypothetical protein
LLYQIGVFAVIECWRPDRREDDMSNQARRAIAATSLVAVLTTGLGACHKKGSSAGPTPSPSATTAQQMLGTGDPFADIRTAARHMPDTAAAIATGLAQSNSATASPAPTPKSAVIAGDPDSAAAQLRAKLAYLLTEHVYLTGLTVATIYHFGADTPQYNAAAGAVSNNATDLADVIGTVAPNDRASFLEAWQQHVTDFVNYAKDAKIGGAGGDAAKKAAQQDLAGYAKAEGDFFSRITHNTLTAAKVQQAFTTHISSVVAAVDAMASGRTADEFKLLKTAADHMTDDAATLASGIAKASNVVGDPDSKASGLRADLTGLLTAHVYLAGVTVFTAYSTPGGTTTPAYQGSIDALDSNSQALATAIGSVAGPLNQSKFLATWRSHLDDFITYAKADASNDVTGRTTAQNNLLAYTAAAGAFFSDITGGALNASTVAGVLKDHVTSVEAAIDSLKTAVADVPVVSPPPFGPSASATPTGSSSPSPSGTPSASPSPSSSASPTATASPSHSPTASPSATPTPSATRAVKKKQAARSPSRKVTPTPTSDADQFDAPDDEPGDDRGGLPLP